VAPYGCHAVNGGPQIAHARGYALAGGHPASGKRDSSAQRQTAQNRIQARNVVRGDRNAAAKPANCGLLGRLWEIFRFEGLRGGAGRTRTSIQIVMGEDAVLSLYGETLPSSEAGRLGRRRCKRCGPRPRRSSNQRAKGTVLRCRLQILKPYPPAAAITRLVREPCANILPAIRPVRSGYWAQFAACSGIARQDHPRSASSKPLISGTFDDGRDRDRTVNAVLTGAALHCSLEQHYTALNGFCRRFCRATSKSRDRKSACA
jgi:hypothetical protein